MGFFRHIEKKAKMLRWYHFSLLKSAMILFTLFVLAAWPAAMQLLLSIHWSWYLGLFIVCIAPLCKLFYLD